MSKAKQKGNALELAVHRIEEAFLKRDPSLRGAVAEIERNKRIVVAGVPYEIDVLVTLHRGTPYESIHIFECKNWTKPVGIDEIQKIESKRDKVSAHSATVVARLFTSPAEKLAEQTKVKLLVASEELLPLEVYDAPAISHKIENGSVEVTFRHPDPTAPAKLDFDTSECEINGRGQKLSTLLHQLIQDHLTNLTRADPRRKLPGAHSGRTSLNRVFSDGSVTITGREVARIGVNLDYSVEIYFPTITAKFGVAGRGGFIRLTYPPGTMGHDKAELEITTKPV